MKFQKYLEENQISLWKDFYLNYSLLKKNIKAYA
jgi:SPX domain protein involved in polyphosphate accumulation